MFLSSESVLLRAFVVNFLLLVWTCGTFTAAASDAIAADLCLLPVKNGKPSAKDLAATGRMVAKVVVIEGIEKPIIYPLNDKGVWTISDDHSFSQFGGDFPDNFHHDRFARNPVTGSTVGVSPSKGVFVIKPGEVSFTRLYQADGAPLRHPGQAIYVARLNGTVISDPSGLYLLDRQFRLQKLSLSQQLTKSVQALIDLPDISALLISSGNSVFLRDNSGHMVLLATLQKWDGVRSADITDAETIRIRSNWSEFSIAVPTRDVSGRFLDVEGADVVRPRTLVFNSVARPLAEATLGGRTYVFSARELAEKTLYSQTLVATPFDSDPINIEAIIDFSRAEKIVVFAHAGIFALDSAGTWTEIPGSKGRIGYGATITDLKSDKGVLVAAKDALYLLISSASAAAEGCLK